MTIITENVGPISTPSETYTIPSDVQNKRISEQNELRNYIVDAVVMPSMRNLLSRVLMTINASIPNKDQNRAVTNLIRDHFDQSYFTVLNQTFPEKEFGATAGSYAVGPEPEKRSTNTLP
jgi:hypothetical protein